MNDQSPFALPYLKEIFEKLRRGRHICAEDGNLFYALRDNIGAFTELFHHLGFRLESHSRGFYYFQGEGSLTDTSNRMAVFVFIIMEYLAGEGEAVEEGMMTKTFVIDDLPHLKSDRYRTYMNEVGIVDEDELITVINNIEYYGFITRKANAFHFRVPAYRFLDICMQLLKMESAAPSANGQSV